MNIIESFDPFVFSSGNIITNGINANEQILLFNSSSFCLQLTFSDFTKDYLPPGWVRTWTKSSPLNIIKYTTTFNLGLTQPVSIVYGTIYEAGEHIDEVSGPIQYVFNVSL